MTQRAYIALGANLGDRAGQLAAATAAVGDLPQTMLAAQSRIYVTAPVGAAEPQPDYYNAVIGVDTGLPARDLLAALQQIELDAGRRRIAGARNTARTLDLDILLYGNAVIAEPGLQIPHPRMQERAFVLRPLADIAPHAIVPGHGAVRDLLARVAGQSIAPLTTVTA